jgi:dipeptidyl aminopeptidase/acylaminoacyl peptidase
MAASRSMIWRSFCSGRAQLLSRPAVAAALLGALLAGPAVSAAVQGDAGRSEAAQPDSAPSTVPSTALPAPRLVHRYLETRLSPDGTRVASVEGDSPPGGFAPDVRDLIIRAVPESGRASRAKSSEAQRPAAMQSADEVPVALPCGRVPQCWPGSLAWTPDAKRLTFALRTPGSHDYALYSVARDGRDLRAVLAFHGTLQDLKYFHDGTLALLAVQGADKEVGATQAGAPVSGDLDAPPPEQRIAILDAAVTEAAPRPGAHAGADASGNPAATLQWASPPGLFVYQYDWRADGQGFIGTAAPGDGDANWWTAKLYAFQRSDGAARVTYTPTSVQQQLAEPRVSPDGRTVAFIGGLMSDFISTGGDVYVLDLANDSVRNVTPDLVASATALEWGCDGGLLVQLLKGDQTQIVSLGRVSGSGGPPGDRTAAPRPLWSGKESLAGLGESGAQACVAGRNPAARATTVQTHQSFTAAPEIEVGPIGHWRDLTRVNAGLTLRARVLSIHWRDEGFDEQGWLLLPYAAANQRIPMVSIVHGGPAAANTPGFSGPGLISNLLARGWAVFLPNPRGSFGQGERFTAANVRDFGYGDLRDILEGIDAAERVAPIDDGRLGITGGSYGGYMAMWAVTQTQRFKAAVADAGLSDWLSYYGENGIDEWMIPYFGASVYDDPAVYARSAPINFVRNVHTPTFEYVGENDIECPASQTQEFWHALKDLHVPTAIMIYPGEGHGLRKPADVTDALARTLAWFGRYLQ